ncbi:MAG: YczE/YyaS/YitT family protein [Solirubrobacteraceae bacterium]
MRLPRGARSVPATPWSARSRWRARPSTIAVLLLGLWLFGTGEALLIEAGIGNSPWTVFAEGLGDQVGISIGAATFATSLAILLSWPLLHERPGLGTLANAVVVAVAIDVMRPVMPRPGPLGLEVVQVLAGIGAIGIGSGLYLTCNLGPGARDGLMTALHRILDQPVARIRMAIEVTAVAAGWALGGTVGAGTIMFALLIGWAVSMGLALAGSA